MKASIIKNLTSPAWKKVSFLGVLSTALLFGGCKKSSDSSQVAESTQLTNSKTTANASAAIGSGWVETTAAEENEYRIHFENSGVKTILWNDGVQPWYMDANNVITNTANSASTLGYSYNSAAKEHSFSMIKYPGKRSEIKILDEYLTGSRQFEGFITVTDKVWGSNAVFQILGSSINATLMQIRANGGSSGTLQMFQNGGETGAVGDRYITRGITGIPTRINVIHKQQTATEIGKVSIYVNGVFKFSFFENQNPTNTPANYMKFGNYGRYSPDDDAKTGSVVKWSNVRVWKDGTDGTPTPSYYKIKILNNPNYILHSASATPTNGTNVDVYANGTYPTQQWQLIDTELGYKRIASRINPNLVLESVTTPANGVNVQLGTWGGNSNTRQQWLFTEVGNGAHKISLRADANQVLDCSATPANGVNVHMWNYVGINRQQWILEPVIN
jgi:hypothetical protein